MEAQRTRVMPPTHDERLPNLAAEVARKRAKELSIGPGFSRKTWTTTSATARLSD